MIRFPAVLLLALAACSRSGGSRPDEVFQKVREASLKKDWNTVYENFDPQDSDLLLFSVLMAAGSSTAGNPDAQREFDALGEKHGVKKDPISNPADREAAKKAISDKFSPVHDKRALFVDTMNFIGKFGTDASVTMPDGTLRDVVIEGDRAKGTLDKGSGKTETIHFVRRDGRWYLASGL